MKVNHIYTGDTLEMLKTFPDECVDLIVITLDIPVEMCYNHSEGEYK